MEHLPSNECPTCTETKLVMKVLPCSHEFCVVCLERVQNGRPSFPCPYCRTEVNLGDAMAESLPNRYYGFLNCESTNCGIQHRSDRIRWCEECRKLMCLPCLVGNAHFLLKHSKGRKFESLDSLKAACFVIKEESARQEALSVDKMVAAFRTALQNQLLINQTLQMMGAPVGPVSGSVLSREVLISAVDNALDAYHHSQLRTHFVEPLLSTVRPDPVERGEMESAPTTEEYITLKVVGEDSNEVHFRAKMGTPMRRLKQSFAARVGVSATNLRFLFDADRINDDDTPRYLDMEHNDVIEIDIAQSVRQDTGQRSIIVSINRGRVDINAGLHGERIDRRPTIAVEHSLLYPIV